MARRADGGQEPYPRQAVSLADIQLLVFLDFFAGIKQPINPELANIVAWHARVKARPSAAA
jgi:glutathione S-transferase